MSAQEYNPQIYIYIYIYISRLVSKKRLMYIISNWKNIVQISLWGHISTSIP